MNDQYRQTTRDMESKGVDQEYIIGWQCGFLGHPQREEQRSTEAYQAGYDDGNNQKTDGFNSWIKQ